MMRHFCDDAGLLWDVYEVEPSGRTDLLPPEYAHGWLLFERDGARRRYAPVPIDWVARTDRDLIAMLGRATPVRRRDA